MTDRLEGAWPSISGRLENGRHILAVRVYHEDTDFTGVVYHGSFVRFLERGRSDFLRMIGISHSALMPTRAGHSQAFAVHRLALDYVKPARIDDLLEIMTEIVEVRGARLVMGQRVTRAGEDLVRGLITIAMVDNTGRPRRVPPEIASKLTICLR